MLSTLRSGWHRCHPEQALRLQSFLGSHSLPGGGFVGRHGQFDLYYTMFGLMLATVMEQPLNENQQRQCLKQFEPTSLDLAHLACLARAARLLDMRFSAQLWERWQQAAGANPESYPHRDPSSPYSQFLLWSLAGDLGVNFTPHNLSNYHLQQGLYANLVDDQQPATNATAAAVMLLHVHQQEKLDSLRPDLRQLAEMQHPDGGFPATRHTPIADLLSTATASLALSSCHHQLKYSLRPFLRQAITASGGFAALAGDQAADLEYTAYGLMAMGLTE